MCPHPQPHFLLVTIAAQGQINPARQLAHRLARIAGARATLATPLSSHRRLFPSAASSSDPLEPIEDEAEPLVSYAPYSDGYEGGINFATDDRAHFVAQLKTNGTRTITRLARDLAARGRPVTCVVYTILLSWAADVARDLAVPSVLYWIQPAAVFSIFYHFFRGSFTLDHQNNPSSTIKLPGLPPLGARDLPSMLVNAGDPLVGSFEEIFQTLDKEREKTDSKPRVVLNTFYELESDVISALDEHFEMIPIGPLVERNVYGRDLFEQDKSEYMEWLETKEEGSVVYISFGSLSRISKRQMEEFAKGLAACGRPYLWVVRRDGREEAEGVVGGLEGKEGMVVEWCDQVRVLSHRSIGCFVTHCGWNSMAESLVCGVPMVMLPQWADQATNARMVEEMWGTGLRGVADEEGVMEGGEFRRCLNLVMGEGGAEMRKRAGMWRDKAREAVMEGGSSNRNLTAFVEEI